jgi:hypothetical protein
MKIHMTTAAALGCLALGGAASAQVKRQVDFTVIYATSNSSGSTSHVLKASCSMFEGEPGFTSLDGAPKSVTAPGSAMGNLQAEMEKCGSNAACAQALMTKVMQNGTMTNVAADMSEKNYTLWTPTICTGTLTVDDRSSRKGMDAMAAYAETVATKGSAEVPPWQGLAIQHDLKQGVTEYRFAAPQPVMVDRVLVRTGAGATTEKSQQRVAAFDPKVNHVKPGAPKSDHAVRPMSGGSVTFDWTVVR